MKQLASLAALGLVAFVVACGDDSETSTSGGGGAGSGGEAASGGSTSSGSPTTSTGTQATTGSTGSTTSTGAETTTSSQSTGAGGEGQGGGASGAYCTPRAADRDRFVVVGHPFGDGAYITDWEVLALSQSGALTQTGKHFQMGSAEDKPIAFSADGSIGIAVQRDYDLGVFRLDEAGNPTVVDASAFGIPDVTPDSVTLAPSGDYFVVSDVNWPNNGGGLYRIDIDCSTGELSGPTLLIETKNSWAVAPLGGDRWAMGGVGADGVEGGFDIHVLDAGSPWSREGGADAFPGGDVVAQALGAARDGSLVVVGNYSAASANGVALVGTAEGSIGKLGDTISFPTPYGVAVAPSGDVAIVTSAEESMIGVFDIDPSGAEPFSYRGEVDYAVAGTQLPGALVMIQRGSLDGLVLVGELEGVRAIRFGAGGTVDNTDFLVLAGQADDFTTIPYGIGVQP